FFSSRRRHTRFSRDWSSDVCSSDLAFEFDPRTRVVFGFRTLSRLGELASGLGGTRVLLVTDRGLQEAGHEGRAVAFLQEAGIDRSEERRVGRECRCGWAEAHEERVD